MPSPTKEPSQASVPPPTTQAHNPLLAPTELVHAPPSPRTHRALRRLQSAHSLGAKASSQQQLLQAQLQQRSGSPVPIHLPPPNPPQPQLQHHTAALQPQPSLISQQRLLQRDQQQQHSGTPQVRNPSPIRREVSLGNPVHHSHMTGQQVHRQQQQYQQQAQQTSGGGSHQPHQLMAPNRSPQRGRANSEAQSVQHHVNMSAAKRAAAQARRSAAADAMSLERLLRDGPPDGDVSGALESTRLKILDGGIKSDSDGMSSLRIYVWLILLSAPILSTNDYLALIHRGASPAYSKIRNDTFRTLTTDPLFRRRVSEASLIRLLNAVAWRLHDAREELKEKENSASRPTTRSGLHHNHGRPSLPLDVAAGPPVPMHQHPNGQPIPASSPTSAARNASTSAQAARASRARALTLTTEGSGESTALATASEPGTYVQGMNVLAAPFLYAARSEAEAFVAFYQLLTVECPGYIRGAMDGVHKGLALVDKVLAIIDPKLSMYLTTKNMSAEIYAFPSVLTLCACTPPLPEVLKLWDFLFAYGPHLNILCIVAQLELIRNQILSNPSPNKLLRSFPALQADQIKATTLTIIKRIPDDVYAEIVAHAK